MCIRDRSETANKQLAKLDKTEARRITKFLRERLAVTDNPRTVGTVSYTHLRAHETVLDLVCRLLLEKKHQKMLQKVFIIEIHTSSI